MADVSVQNERNNGWIPSSATNVIMNWPERIKTQPHDDRDNCFQHFDSKGPCGMTVNNDIDDDSATKHSDSNRGVVKKGEGGKGKRKGEKKKVKKKREEKQGKTKKRKNVCRVFALCPARKV